MRKRNWTLLLKVHKVFLCHELLLCLFVVFIRYTTIYRTNFRALWLLMKANTPYTCPLRCNKRRNLQALVLHRHHIQYPGVKIFPFRSVPSLNRHSMAPS